MEKRNIVKGNGEKYSGFAKFYNKNMLKPPKEIMNIIIYYLKHQPNLVIDLGCGTGLSTEIWSDYAREVIGVEPDYNMVDEAKKSAKNNVSFINVYSNNIELEDSVADVITCAQSFHWMEPISTLDEVNRILKNNGIFSVYDYDMIPKIDENLELVLKSLIRRADETLERYEKEEDKAYKWSKEKHLRNIIKSGYFDNVEEIFLQSEEEYTDDEFIDFVLALDEIQIAFRKYPGAIREEIKAFKASVYTVFNNKKRNVLFSYKVIIAIKKGVEDN